MKSKGTAALRVRAARIEAMESRRLMSVAVPANSVPLLSEPMRLESKGNGPNQLTIAVSTPALDAGVTHFLVATEAHQLA